MFPNHLDQKVGGNGGDYKCNRGQAQRMRDPVAISVTGFALVTSIYTFVTLGLYHLEGIPGTLKADPNVAREMFRYAAAYFADPEAQYQLGRMYLLGKGASKDAIQAARWLRLSANKGDHRAQALLGGMLFKGEDVSRQAALGLFWLIVAKDGAKPDETWITDMYTSALAQANETERAMARKYLEDWLKSRRE